MACSTYILLLFVSFLLHLTLADEFNCTKLPPLTKPAQNVYELRPQDIKVVMALGDSVTAGTLIKAFLTIMFSLKK